MRRAKKSVSSPFPKTLAIHGDNMRTAPPITWPCRRGVATMALQRRPDTGNHPKDEFVRQRPFTLAHQHL
jgi:hypothetical protein